MLDEGPAAGDRAPSPPPGEDKREAGRGSRGEHAGAGRGTVVARASGGRTVLAIARAASPLRLVQPTFPSTKSAAVCLVTFGGGLVDGDRIEVELAVEEGATLVVFTQSSTKVFRGSSSQRLHARVAGTLVLLPDPVAAFAGASYAQRVEVELVASGACVVLDAFTSGRAAFGERWAMRSLDLRTRITHDGRAILTDALRLDADDGSIPARAGRFDAFATLVAAGRGATPVVEAIRRTPIAPPTEDLVVAASPLASSSLPRVDGGGPGGAIARIAASSPSVALDAVRARLRNLPDIDAVDPFASRY